MHSMFLTSPTTVITTPRSDIFPIGRPSYAQYLIRMTLVDMCGLSGESIPYSDCVVKSCRSDRCAIRRPGHCCYPCYVLSIDQHICSREGIPHFDCAIIARGSNTLAGG